MDKLKELMKLCKCSISLAINEHRDVYQSVEEYFNSDPLIKEEQKHIPEHVYCKMIKNNTIIELHFYPDTPIGSYSLYHYKLDSILFEAIEILKNQ